MMLAANGHLPISPPSDPLASQCRSTWHERLTNQRRATVKRRCTRRQSGTAMVEMVIVLPLLLTLMFGIAELSIAMMRWQTIGNAAREGAREGSLFRTNCGSSAATDAEQAAEGALVAANVTGATITVGGTCVTPGSTTVTVTAPYTFILLPNFVGTLADELNLTATSVMRNSNPSGA